MQLEMVAGKRAWMRCSFAENQQKMRIDIAVAWLSWTWTEYESFIK